MSGNIAELEEWFYENETIYVIPYIEKKFNSTYAQEAEYNFMRQHLYFTKKIIKNSMLDNDTKFLKFLEMFAYGKSKICTIIGGRGSGKTALAMFVIEQLFEKGHQKNIYYVKKGERPEWLPSWIHSAQAMEEVPNKSFAVLDETVLEYGSRNFYSDENKSFTERLVILRHKDTSIFLITQHSKLIDINIRRLSDILIYKKGSNIEEEGKFDEERHLILNRLMPRKNTESLIEIRFLNIFWVIETELPSFWDDNKVSKTFKDFNPEQKKRMERTKRYKEEIARLQEKENIRAKNNKKDSINVGDFLDS